MFSSPSVGLSCENQSPGTLDLGTRRRRQMVIRSQMLTRSCSDMVIWHQNVTNFEVELKYFDRRHRRIEAAHLRRPVFCFIKCSAQNHFLEDVQERRSLRLANTRQRCRPPIVANTRLSPLPHFQLKNNFNEFLIKTFTPLEFFHLASAVSSICCDTFTECRSNSRCQK